MLPTATKTAKITTAPRMNGNQKSRDLRCCASFSGRSSRGRRSWGRKDVKGDQPFSTKYVATALS
jgi:hypothetical protein